MFGACYGDKSGIACGGTEERLAVSEGNLGVSRAVDEQESRGGSADGAQRGDAVGIELGNPPRLIDGALKPGAGNHAHRGGEILVAVVVHYLAQGLEGRNSDDGGDARIARAELERHCATI